MSGYFGIVRFDGTPVAVRILEAADEAIRFRGPDGNSVWRRNHVGGCFSFLRTGPANQESQQPLIGSSRYYLWGDIRLDGREELLSQLGETPGSAASLATSELLLLRAWEKWGPACLEHALGEFSFALWDSMEEVLWCARDFVGVRPLYYARAQKAFCFSNTLQVLRLVPEVSSALDESFIGDFLLEGWNADASRTVYHDIKRLPAGHLLKLSKDTLEVRRFRTLPVEEALQYKRPEEYLEAYRDVLLVAVKDRLPEGPGALYLSGGLDSASVCAIAAQIAGEQGATHRLKAFTLSWKPFFDDPEPAFATITARHLRLAHEILQEETITPFEEAEREDRNPAEPNQEIFFAREQRNYTRISQHANVVLSGDGGDDVLTGQAWPYLSHLLQEGEWKRLVRDFGGYFWTHKALPPLRAGIRGKLRRWVKPRGQYGTYPNWLNPEFEARTKLQQRWLELQAYPKNTVHPLHPEAYHALHDGFWSSVLETEDAGWTRVRLETRAPLLDLRVLRFLLRLPPVPWCVKKELCRQAMRNLLPQAVLERPKTPLVKEPIETIQRTGAWFEALPKATPGPIESFVNWPKWCETLVHSKGSLRWIYLRPVSLFHWLKAVENK